MAKKKPQRPSSGQQSSSQAKREARASQRAAAAAEIEAARRKAKRNAWIKLGLIAFVILGLVAVLVLIPILNDKKKRDRIAGLPLESIGASPAAAGCRDLKTEKVVVPADGWHVDVGTHLDYDTAPPAYGKHWGEFLQTSQYRTIFSVGDRPPKEQLVHSLEHGHTVVWYDETLASDAAELAALQKIAKVLRVDDDVVIVPWTTTGDDADGGPFPDGAHLAMTHWAGSATDGTGIWQYCDGVSGEALKKFMIRFPKSDSPEPEAP